jgi:hypothetical protein
MTSPPAVVERADVDVMFVRAKDSLDDIQTAWRWLEKLVPLHGRKFFGTFDESTQEYRACVQLRDEDDPRGLGLETGTIRGGRYLRARLRGEPPGVYEQIAPTFAELAKAAETDPTRPSIEFYRRRDEIDLLLPVPSHR